MGVNAVAVVATPPVVSDRQPIITEGALAVLRSRSLRFLVIRAPTGELDLAQLLTVDDLAVDASGGRRWRCWRCCILILVGCASVDAVQTHGVVRL